MPKTCIVVGCGSRGDRDAFSFYRVPGVLNSKHYPHLNDLSFKRREMWIAAIKRDDLTEGILRNQRVCSRHFITGKPSSMQDINHPDWTPSQIMGHVSQPISKRKSDVDRKIRIDKRRKRDNQIENKPEVPLETEVGCMEEQGDGIASQTDVTMEILAVQFEQLSFASKKIFDLQKKIENSPFGLMENTNDIRKWKYYTGFQFKFVETIFEEVKKYISTTSTTVLIPFNQLLVTLIKLRLNLHFKHLAYVFQISPTTASTYFGNIINILYARFKGLIIWPERYECKRNIPSCFREAFQENTTVIVDCFEIFIEKPEKYITQQQCWSNYKHHHTVKFLIGITPQGSVNYISKAWGGRTSDKQIVENSGFCNYIKPGDIVLADRGFLISETLGVLRAKLVIPAFTRNKNQLHPMDIEATRHIAHVRIHVERIIGCIKNKFGFFKGPIPISMLKKGNSSEDTHNLLDKVVTVCCALINLNPPLVPL